MTLRINTNLSAINTHNHLKFNDRRLNVAMEKLSSGLRINRASDDAAGLSISESLRAQVIGHARAGRNAQDAISLLNVAEGAMNEMAAVLQRARELAVQASNGSLTDTDRNGTQEEIDALMGNILEISSNTSFNNLPLLGAFQTISFQVGAQAGQVLAVDIPQVDQGALGVSGLLVATQPDAQQAILDCDFAIAELSQFRTDIGAATNRLGHTIENLAATGENLMSAESRIRDVDVASEMGDFTRLQVLLQSTTAMLAQANSSPQGVLSLFQ